MKTKRNQPFLMYERISECMRIKGYTDKKMADVTGMERKTILAYRHGDACPSALTVAKMCEVLGVSADYLIFGR